MDDAVDLYEEDFVRWATDQARTLRDAAASGTNLPVDWLNIAEEIDALGGSLRRELRSQIGTVLEHLLKLKYSPVTEPRPGWESTVSRTRIELSDLLKQSPSLRRDVETLIADQNAQVARFVGRELLARGEISSDLADRLPQDPFSAEQVLGDWFPDPCS